MMDINVAEVLIEAKNKGVEVEVIIDRECLNHYTVSELYQNKVDVWVYKPQNNIVLMHNKFCIFTENVEHKSLFFIGSYNFTYNASSFHQESIIILDNVSIIKQNLKYFSTFIP